MKPYHIFFDFDGWLAVAHKNEPVYIMPIQTTKPGKQVVWKENRTQLSQIQENRVHHCLFLEARWIENFESEQERQERRGHEDRRQPQPAEAALRRIAPPQAPLHGGGTPGGGARLSHTPHDTAARRSARRRSAGT